MKADTPDSELAEYIADLTSELAEMAHRAGYKTLSYLLATSSMEANNIVCGVNDNTHSSSDQRHLI
jgi:hypothetical protein